MDSTLVGLVVQSRLNPRFVSRADLPLDVDVLAHVAAANALHALSMSLCPFRRLSGPKETSSATTRHHTTPPVTQRQGSLQYVLSATLSEGQPEETHALNLRHLSEAIGMLTAPKVNKHLYIHARHVTYTPIIITIFFLQSNNR